MAASPSAIFDSAMVASVWKKLLVTVILSVGCSRTQVPAEPVVGQRVADAFLAQLRAGHFEAAWQSTSAEFKSDEGKESFIRDVKAKPLLRGPLIFVSYDVTELNGLKRGQCIYKSPPGKKLAVTKVRVVVGQDAGEWRVEGIFVEP